MNNLTKRMGLTFLLASTGAVALAACGSDDDTSAPVVDAGTHADVTVGTMLPSGDAGLAGQDFIPDSGGDSGLQLTDGQIYQILHAANLGEVSEAKLAETMAQTSTIKNIASMFDMMHTMADTQLMAAATMDNISAADSSPASFLQNMTTMDESQYSSLSGDAFDEAYFRNQLTAHTQVLSYIMSLLLPQVKDAGLKTQVQAAQTMVSMHLMELQALEVDGGGFDSGAVSDSGDGGGDAADGS